jgi:hypothetical protein
MIRKKHIKKIVENNNIKLTFQFSHISEVDRIKICDDYLKYSGYENIKYYTYDYCLLYNLLIIEDNTEFIIDDENGYYIERGDVITTKEKITSFEEIYQDYLNINKMENRNLKLNSILLKPL